MTASAAAAGNRFHSGMVRATNDPWSCAVTAPMARNLKRWFAFVRPSAATIPSSSADTAVLLWVMLYCRLRGHVNFKKIKKSKKTLEVGGWVKCPIGNFKKLENIFLYILLLRFWASIRTSMTLLMRCYAFVLASMYRYSWLITFEIFQNFFFIEGWVGGVCRIQTFFGFL